MEDRFAVPAPLQVMGRMHPLLLHFPIVLILIYALFNLFIIKKQQVGETTRKYADLLLLLGAFTAALSALMGLFLSREEGYDPESLQWHKWTGVGISLFAICWYMWRLPLRRRKISRILSSAFSITLLIMAGHAGAGITHGEDFLLAPIQSDKEESRPALSDAMVFDHVIQPILEEKCMNCHNPQKAKGELVMTTRELLLKGGKTGPLWDTAHPGRGLLLERVYLPLSEKKHMPPRGKPQLTPVETEMLQLWIMKGAGFDLKLSSLPPEDRLYELASVLFETTSAASYDFAAADPDLIRELNTENRVVMAESQTSPGVIVSFFNSTQFQPAQLKEMDEIATQIISLDLTRMPVGSAEMEMINRFKNLRKLNLAFTDIKAGDLKWLKDMEWLESLSLSGTAIAANDISALQKLPRLKKLYAWEMQGNDAEWEKWQTEWKDLAIERGFSGDTIKLKLSAPVLENEQAIISGPTPLRLKHYIKGAEIRYTLDGSEPDSLQSPIYRGDEMIDQNVLIRARAYKPGWYSSDLLEASLYKRSHVPDSILFLTATEPAYSPKSSLLLDLQKGEVGNFRDGNWLAWRSRPMELLLPFGKTVELNSVTLSTLVDVGSYIMPPAYLEIWGGDSPNQLRKLGRMAPAQPKAAQPAYSRGFECKFEKSQVRYLKIVAMPLPQLPAWHPGRGDRGWLFVDEILIN